MNHKLPWRPSTAKSRLFKNEGFLTKESKKTLLLSKSQKNTKSNSELNTQSERKSPSINIEKISKKRLNTDVPERHKSYDWFKIKGKSSLKNNTLLINFKNPMTPNFPLERPNTASPNYLNEKIDKIKKNFFGNFKQVLAPKKSGYFNFVENNELRIGKKKKWYYMKNLRHKISEEEEEKTRILRDREKKEKIIQSVLNDKKEWWKEKQFEIMKGKKI